MVGFLKDFRCKGMHGRCRRCPISINLLVYGKEGKKYLFFFNPPKLGDHPPMYYERVHRSSFVPLTTVAVAVTTQHASVAY